VKTLDDWPLDAVAFRHILRVLADGETQMILHDVAQEGAIPFGKFMGLPVELDTETNSWVIPLPFFPVEG
jgi:hypothetical protein